MFLSFESWRKIVSYTETKQRLSFWDRCYQKYPQCVISVGFRARYFHLILAGHIVVPGHAAAAQLFRHMIEEGECAKVRGTSLNGEKNCDSEVTKVHILKLLFYYLLTHIS